MIEKDRKAHCIYIQCDLCDTGEFKYDFDGSPEQFRAMWDTAKEGGWKATKNKQDQWVHRCPDCVTKNLPWR